MKHPLEVNAPAEPGRRDGSTPQGREKRRRFVVNITPLERAGRVVVGAIGALGGGLLLASGGGALAIVLEGLLVLAGLDLVVTGVLGHCPLYRKLGYVPPSLRMIVCCVPMLAIAGVLVATGVLSAGFLFLAVGCTAMMALMMRGMGHGRGSDG